MMRASVTEERVRWNMFVVLGLLCILPGVAQAKASPVKVVISGPDIVGEHTVANPQALEYLGLGSLEVLSNAVEPPPQAVQERGGYTMVRYMHDGEGGMFAFDRLRYYHDPAGGTGYIFYEGPSFNGGWSEYDGKWFRAYPAGDSAMRQVVDQLRANKAARHLFISVTPARLDGSVAPDRAASFDVVGWAIVTLLLVLGCVASMRHWRRASS